MSTLQNHKVTLPPISDLMGSSILGHDFSANKPGSNAGGYYCGNTQQPPSKASKSENSIALEHLKWDMKVVVDKIELRLTTR